MHIKQPRRNFSYRLGGIGLGLLAALALALIFPTAPDDVTATEFPSFSTQINTRMATYVRSSIAVSMTNSAAIVDLVPTSTGSFAESSEVALSVATNNTTGYGLYLSTGDNTSTLSLKNSQGETATIDPVSGFLTSDNYKEHLNSWGYNLQSTQPDITTPTTTGEYKALPKEGEEPVVETKKLSSEDSYTLKFATAISTNLPSGMYSNTVVASVVANPLEVKSLTDITTMQEMTANICTISSEGETKKLIDTRDNNEYQVTKLRDGNCWMTENLKLTAPDEPIETGSEVKGRKLTSADSDISEGREWIMAPTYTEVTKENTTSDDPNFLATYTMEATTAKGYGTYYTFNSATAGTGQNVTANGQNDPTVPYEKGNAPDSVCPKGWKLPLVKAEDNGSFRKLFKAYNVSTTADLLVEPLNFAESNMVSVGSNGGGFGGAGKGQGYYWTRVSATRTTAWGLDFNPTGYAPGYDGTRRNARTVRCVAVSQQ